ncbi:TonB-dependent receptor plug domain-containing protein [Sphingomonas rhizophila]|uniref:TonB-dependent receptor plug domain-containing protein n=1 Tax=Sphingomonas rhizophila TaxID=2071607 RepID=UPI001FE7403E|nr:TonB-dependent receptor [Sphingomonas rhizophila]
MIDQSRIGQSASGRLEDVLRDAAGALGFRRSDSRSSHATNQSITLRGLGGNASSRALLLLDGVPQGDPFGGWISFPAYSTERIGLLRVTRGGGSAYFGPGALAGTVELESAAPGSEARIAGSLAAGSRDSLDARASLLLPSAGRFVTLSGAVARGDGFVPVRAADRGPIDRPAPYRQSSGSARIVQDIGTTEAQLSLGAFDDRRDRGVPFTSNRGKGFDTSLRVVGKGATRWSTLVYAQFRNFASSFSSIDEGRTSSTQTLDQYSVPSRGLGFRAEISPTHGPIGFRLGADGRFVSGTTRENYQFVAGEPTRKREAGGRSRTVGMFAAASVARGAATLNASGRVDRWAIGNGTFVQQSLDGPILTDMQFNDRGGWQASGRLAGEVAVTSRLSLRAAAYRGWRLPTLNELYRPFRAGADATAPNAELDPETMVGAEVGGDVYLATDWNASVTGYTARLDGAIANVTLGTGPGVFPIVGFVGTGGAYRQRQNLDSILSRGFEADVAGKLGTFDARLSYAFVDARVEGTGAAASLDGKRPAQTPRHQLSATIGWSSVRDLDVSVTGRLLSAQFEDDLNSRRLDPAVTFDGFASLP